MKIIHTSDWHIGQTLHQFSRDNEHQFFFNQLKNIILEEKPDALLISGDVFHSATPTIQAQKLYYHSLIEFSRLDPDLQIIVTAGNHDSPSRLEAPRELWSAFNVTVIGNLDFYKDDKKHELSYDASKIQIPIKRNDRIIAWVLAVPFLNAGNYPSLEVDDSYSNRVFSFYTDLKENLKSNLQYIDNHPIIAMGHFMLNGINNNANILIGGLESVDSKDISIMQDIDYWALGHVHHPQFVANNVRYSGSPFALTFNEIYQHSVTVVEIESHNVEVRIREIEPLIQIIDFPSKPHSYNDAVSIEELIDKIPEILDNECYVRLHLKSEMSLSSATNARLMEMFEGKKAKYCGVQVYLPLIEDEKSANSIRTLDEFKAISPFELGCSVYKKKNNTDMPDEMKVLFKEVCDENTNKH